jgi:predicted O-methyltransferase YrrM
MNFVSDEIMDYAEKHSSNEPELLKELRKETWQKILVPRMLSGHLQGRLLSAISKMIQPKSVLEIGTYTGYATLCLAEGLTDKGVIYTIDNNEELVDFQRKYFKKSRFNEQIIQFTGEAIEVIPNIDTQFDLVFIDADKKNYSRYFELIIEKLNKGGIILSDNVLWSGKVLQAPSEKDIDTQSLIDYNNLVKNDIRLETVLLPFRDGLSISRKLQ